ncbi:hypothetical protein ACFQX8_26195 [Klenkia terrae]|uniref:hypothetical protein n=1 Tax=Klenkia terrae TaxID=1052259 RepID=UPI00361FCBBD
MSIVSSTLAVGGVIGLVVTGLLTSDGGDYHRPFWLGLGIALVALALAAWALPDRPASATGGVDWWGAVVLGAGLVLLLLPLSQGHTWGWGSPAPSAAWSARSSCWPAGSCCSAAGPTRSCARSCSPTGGCWCPTSPG